MEHEPGEEPADPTSLHRGFGSLALAGVGLLLLVAATRVWQLIGSMGPPAPPELVRAHSLVEWASDRHLRPAPAKLPRDLPTTLEEYRTSFPELNFRPEWPAGWPAASREVLAAAFHPDRGALQVRYRDREGHGSLFLLEARDAPPARFVRGGLQVRVLPPGRLAAVVVEATPRDQ